MNGIIIVVDALRGSVDFVFGVQSGLVYTVAPMTNRLCTSRTTVLLAGPALIAMLAILAGSPVWTTSNGSSRLSVASLVVLAADVLPSVERPSTAGLPPAVAPASPARTVAVHVDRHRIGLLRLVLPPPSA